ncbi:polysaccharide export protein [Mucilaginibacter terrenus]|uniref:Polysaccharide export protein n=1 Tax=Mucilaginibacter terrenus TaxID=2482727 RepID=A0A3E2NXK6_9SPHI|nr:polysaccharide biosynthesis/export family protein [Mucilaginibacter terrenus]RFZ85756.1 polysaccharide export protein [Mucilaginibacter terrenus]
MKLKHLLPIFLALAFFVSSCTSYKNVPYFQDLNRDSIHTEDITNKTPLTIQPGDLLGIHVTSMNPDASYLFNYNLERPSGTNLDKSEQNAVVGYLVDKAGNIRLPLVGDVNVLGMSTFDIAKLLEEKLLPYLTKPRVNVRIQNFKVSVMGDVRAPGVYTINNERATVTEALSLAGDLYVTGIRKILLVREVDGKRTYVPLDLTSKNLFNSPYYYLKNNDMIYVQPNQARAQNEGTTFQKAGLLVSALSILAILLTR